MGECVLVVDDDREIVKAINILLKGEGYEVLKAYDGLQALDILSTHPVKLVLIDVMMPKLDGLSALMRIREKQNIPIIVLSAKSEDSDKVLGLSMGADDYVAKPYNPQELAARVKSHLRRYTSLGDIHTRRGEDEIVNGRLSFKTDERVLYADGEAIRLTATETKIVELFMRNLGRVFPAEEIYQRVWEEEAFASEKTVMVIIHLSAKGTNGVMKL
ncbi:MAG: response regulator transcription factor, partial [Lachnospiraceae bacterium]|nr:response regulator transcription factor [Lachnospiraceae bacterium]